MPVKNTKRRTNDGLEGVITGLTEEEKKVLEDAGIGGGSSGGGIAITNFEEKLKTNGVSNLSWNTYDSHPHLEPNTSYNVGDCFVLDYSPTFGTETLNENQFIVPESITIVPENFISSLKFGDVILGLSALSAYPNYVTSDNKTFELKGFGYMYFTVIKAGTTGASITLPRAPKTYLKYGIYTIGESTSK